MSTYTDIRKKITRFEAIKIDIELERPISTQDASFLLEKIEILTAQRNLLCGQLRDEF